MLSLWGDFDDLKDRMEQLELVVNDEPDELKQLDILHDVMDIVQEMSGTAWTGYSNITQSHLPEN